MGLVPDAIWTSVDVDGAIVRYAVGGSGTIPLVLLHGTGGTAESHFGRTLAMLASRYRVIGINLGISGDGRQLELDDLVRQVAAVIDREAFAPHEVVLVGYSLGAVVAAAYASTRPLALGKLVLICGWLATDGHLLMRNRLMRRLAATDHSTLAEFSVLTAFSPQFLRQRSAGEIEGLVATRKTPSPDWHAHMELNARVAIGDRASRINVPTLVIGAEHDSMVPIQHSRLLFGAIDDARFAAIPTGHAVAAERPAQLFQFIDLFSSGRMTTPSGEIYAPEKI